jgi:hypothetical protein
MQWSFVYAYKTKLRPQHLEMKSIPTCGEPAQIYYSNISATEYIRGVYM